MLSFEQLFGSWVFFSLANRRLKKIYRQIEKEDKSEVKKQQYQLDKAYKKYIKSLEKLNIKNNS